MKRERLLNLMRVIVNLSKERASVKFAYALNRNKSLISPEMDAMGAGEKVFQEARLALCKQYAEKDEKGEPKIKDGVFLGLAGNDLFQKALKDLPEAVSFQKLLDEEVAIDFYKVSVSELPKEISAADLEALDPILTGDLSKI